jgi:pimeloyl-ACP methyl ester carboxylesterase
MTRLVHLITAAVAVLLTMSTVPAAAQPPIVFVHGNGDSAALWITTVWRFESNGYDPSRLFAIDFTHPSARTADTRPQDNRSGTDDALRELSAKVAEIQARTGQKQVVLVGSSRGGNAIRNYLKFGGGAANVSHAVLCGTPNHGTQATNPNLGNEFHGAGPFLTRLNAGTDEVVAGVRFMTIRSDANDKYAQPEGRFVGMPGQPTGVTFAGPELRGATNVVVPGLDHREVAFHRLAFKAMYAFITGIEPRTLDPVPQPSPVLDGLVSGDASGTPTNLPLAGATVEVYEVDPASGERRGDVAHRKTIGADGRWGPFRARSDAYYEFVVGAAGYPTAHVYRTPFARASAYVHLRLRPLADKDRGAGALVTLTRPRGYLGHGRDTFLLDGKVPGGVNEGVPGTSEATQRFEPGQARGVRVVLNAEALMVRTYPLEQGHVTIAEFHY